MLVSNVLVFFLTGLSATLIINLVMFTPYSLIAMLLGKLTYKTKKSAIVRVLVIFTFFTIAFVALISIGSVVIQFPYENVLWVVGVLLPSVIIGLFCIPADYFIISVTDYVCSKIK